MMECVLDGFSYGRLNRFTGVSCIVVQLRFSLFVAIVIAVFVFRLHSKQQKFNEFEHKRKCHSCALHTISPCTGVLIWIQQFFAQFFFSEEFFNLFRVGLRLPKRILFNTCNDTHQVFVVLFIFFLPLLINFKWFFNDRNRPKSILIDRIKNKKEFKFKRKVNRFTGKGCVCALLLLLLLYLFQFVSSAMSKRQTQWLIRCDGFVLWSGFRWIELL